MCAPSWMTTLAGCIHRLLRLKSAVEVFKAFRVAAKNESEKRIREIMRS